MQVIEKTELLFTEITLEESALVSGGLAPAADLPGFNIDNYFRYLGGSALLGAGPIFTVTEEAKESALQAGFGVL